MRLMKSIGLALIAASLFAMAACGGHGSPPPPPDEVNATSGEDSQVSLTWSNVPVVATYKVYHSTVSGGPYDALATVSDLSYVATGLTNGTTYYFVVTTFNADGTSANSVEASATPGEAPVAEDEVLGDEEE